MKQYGAEFFGTFWLVLGGCGSAVLAAGVPELGIGYLGVALAFGLSVLTMAYAIGPISGAHLNPAVSVGLWVGGRFPASQLLPYVVAQVLGGLAAGGVLYLIASGKAGFDLAAGFASNGYGEHSPGGYSLQAALVSEVVLTGMFLLIILGATSKRAPQGFAPIAIGLTLTLIHLISIPVTNTSVNPARSTAVALYVGDWAVSQLWLFWVAPILGAVLGALAYRLIDLSAERDAERQRATLLRFLSHDLRAPHSAILALLDVRPAEDEAGQQVYRQIEQQVRRALGLTDAFVQLAKAESDAYRFEACMFTMLAMDAADQLWPLAQQKDIDLRRDWDDEQEPMVWADPGLLTRALFNLLENAVKYSPAGTVVSLSIRLEGDWLSCRIVDQGKGIAAAELPRLFSQYQRFASAEGSAGLGLGLAMVKTVIDRHGGRIGCQSQVGQGTTFEIRLPLLKGEE